MNELSKEQSFQLKKMVKNSNTAANMTSAFGDIYVFKTSSGKKRAVYCDPDTYAVFAGKRVHVKK